MEKTTNDLSNLSNLPPEIQQHIAAYLDARTLGFFSISDKQRLKNSLPVILKNQIMFPLLPASRGNSTYLFQANQLFVCGDNSYGQLGIGDNKHRSTFTPVKILSKAMQQAFILNQLVKLGLGESDSQYLLKKPGCNLQ